MQGGEDFGAEGAEGGTDLPAETPDLGGGNAPAPIGGAGGGAAGGGEPPPGV